jgi:membrane fusion protein, multidrug efflux system
MKHRVQTTILTIGIIAVAMYVGYAIGRSENQSTADEGEDAGTEVTPTAKVKLATVKQIAMDETTIAYGSVRPLPESVTTVSLKFEAVAVGVPVTVGQPVKKGDALAVMVAAPEAALSLLEAKDAEDAATQDLAQAEKRLNMKLGTEGELINAQTAERAARTRLANLERRSIGKKAINATEDGIVSQVYVRPGQMVSAGDPIIQIAPMSHIGVVLGVEPIDVSKIKIGQEVRLFAVEGATRDPVIGHIRVVSQVIDPEIRAIDVYADVDAPMPFPIGMRIRGEIITDRRTVTAVPREAVRPDGDRMVLFTVEQQKAIRQEVEIGLDDGVSVELIGNRIPAGKKVAIQGVSVLEDGMSVKAAK